jgi:hypothetical protein
MCDLVLLFYEIQLFFEGRVVFVFVFTDLE